MNSRIVAAIDPTVRAATYGTAAHQPSGDRNPAHQGPLRFIIF